jgi:hypothetical protein
MNKPDKRVSRGDAADNVNEIRQPKLLITWWHTISLKAALGAKYPCKSLTLTHCALREIANKEVRR